MLVEIYSQLYKIFPNNKSLVQQTIGLGLSCMGPQCFSNNGHEQTNPDLGFSQVVL